MTDPISSEAVSIALIVLTSRLVIELVKTGVIARSAAEKIYETAIAENGQEPGAVNQEASALLKQLLDGSRSLWDAH